MRNGFPSSPAEIGNQTFKEYSMRTSGNGIVTLDVFLAGGISVRVSMPAITPAGEAAMLLDTIQQMLTGSAENATASLQEISSATARDYCRDTEMKS